MQCRKCNREIVFVRDVKHTKKGEDKLHLMAFHDGEVDISDTTKFTSAAMVVDRKSKMYSNTYFNRRREFLEEICTENAGVITEQIVPEVQSEPVSDDIISSEEPPVIESVALTQVSNVENTPIVPFPSCSLGRAPKGSLIKTHSIKIGDGPIISVEEYKEDGQREFGYNGLAYKTITGIVLSEFGPVAPWNTI
jgi:hypothetical protein